MKKQKLCAVVVFMLGGPAGFLFADTPPSVSAPSPAITTTPSSDLRARYGTYTLEGVSTKHLFTSREVNLVPKKMTIEEQVQIKGKNRDRFYEGVNFSFDCPHFMFISGIKATYDQTAKAYTFAFTCALLENPRGGYVAKTSCLTGFSPADNSTAKPAPKKPSTEESEEEEALHDLPAGASTITLGKSACSKDQQFIQGLTVISYFDQTIRQDAFYKSHCCSVADEQGKPLKASTSCSSSPSFPGASSFVMKCGNNAILKEITSTWDPVKQSRSFSFRCCEVAIP